jgi:hypothetical protein
MLFGPDQPSLEDQAAADSGAEDHAEDAARPASGTVDRLGQREAIGIVGEADVAPQRRADITVERMADQFRRVRVLDQSGGGRDRPRDADPDAAARAQRRFGLRDEFRDRRDDRAIRTARSRSPSAQQLAPLPVQGEDLDLGPTEIYSEADLLFRNHGVSDDYQNLTKSGRC